MQSSVHLDHAIPKIDRHDHETFFLFTFIVTAFISKVVWKRAT
jgi:hypothetical protein